MEKPLTGHIKDDGSQLELKGYEKEGGYRAVKKVIGKIDPENVTATVKDSNLKGRGGAGFGTGMKWGFVPMGEDAITPKYLVANADEMEPGTFKDRLLMEENPHLLIEGMILSAYAIQASIGFIFIRGAYVKSVDRLEKAIHEAREKGYLGKNILKSGFDLDLYIHISVGRYMCGEETALLNALEGRRATPRFKPPYPQASGLFGNPTIVNNVETLCCVPYIMEHGAEAFKNLSYTDEGGTKLYGVSGNVKNPGTWELPLGTTMREVIEEHAGGMMNGYTFRGALPGGASTDFLVNDHMDVKLDFSTVMNVGSRLGTGTLVVLDDKTCPVGFVANLMRFFGRESCGWCTPCRDGIPFVQKTLEAMEAGKGKEGDMDVLESHVEFMGPGNTFCAFAPGAMEPLQSAMKYFGKDFKQHITDKKCAWKGNGK
ncbi:MAG: NADH-quinone oxidoreductase subunit NuoF [Bacteroidales bacterium]|nr:NADH-quinone oxidoreductase subunit NuoF [Bacteroidales bacterium]